MLDETVSPTFTPEPASDPDVDGSGPAPAPRLDAELAGLDALESHAITRGPWTRRAWRVTWPKLIALGLILVAWEIAVWTHWKPFILQTPRAVAVQLWDLLGTSSFWSEAWNTAQRAVVDPQSMQRWRFAVLAMGPMVGTGCDVRCDRRRTPARWEIAGPRRGGRSPDADHPTGGPVG